MCSPPAPAARLILTLTLLLTSAQSQARQLLLSNNCPSPVTPYINGSPLPSLPARGGTHTEEVERDFSGLVYTDANGGSRGGNGVLGAAFHGHFDYYYLLTDPKGSNVGMSIVPFTAPNANFCTPATCSSPPCSSNTTLTYPPAQFPIPSSKAPRPPLYACPSTRGYTITFCPGGSFPTPLPPPPATAGLSIHPNYHSGKCLDVRGGEMRNGANVQIYDCNNSQAQKFILTKYNTHLRVAGTNFCLDAGSRPKNGTPMKLWTCYDGLPAQQWFYTADNRIALAGTGMCLDLRMGRSGNGNVVQIWKCGDGDRNQIWTV